MMWRGVLNLWKPRGWTSREAVNHVQRLAPRRTKIGHAGTLDPLAEGVLVVCIGPATRLIEFAQRGRKRYLATFALGVTSTTDDSDGEILSRRPAGAVTRDQLEALLPEFVGTISQTPPRFSAVHVQGARAYDLARRGEDFDLAPRDVEIFSITLADWMPPHFQLEVECGSGVYIRSLGRDLGERLGVGAMMTALVRTAVGTCTQATARQPDDLDRTTLGDELLSPLTLLAGLPRARIIKEEEEAIRQGKTIVVDHAPADELVLLNEHDHLVAIAIAASLHGQWRPKLVFPPEVDRPQ